MSGINRDAWLAALHATEDPGDPDALTSEEFAALIGMQRTSARARLRKLVESGTARQVKKRVTDSSGRVQFVNAYRLVKETPDAAHEPGHSRRGNAGRRGRDGSRAGTRR